MLVAAPATPENPKRAATIATTRKTIAQRNIDFLPVVLLFKIYQGERLLWQAIAARTEPMDGRSGHQVVCFIQSSTSRWARSLLYP